MGSPAGRDGRGSAMANAALVLVLSLVPLAWSWDPTGIDHRDAQWRPWGCRTCPIPPPAPSPAPADDL